MPVGDRVGSQTQAREAARRFRLLIANLPDLRVFEATLAHDEDVGRMLERLRGTKLTYVDASSLCFMEQHGIRHVSSTDHHLGIAGAKVVPRVQG